MDIDDEELGRPGPSVEPNSLGARLMDSRPTFQRRDEYYPSQPDVDRSTGVGATATTPPASSLISPPPTLSIGPTGARSLSLGRVGKSSTISRDFSDIPLDTGMNPQAVRKEIKMLERKIRDLRARQPDLSVERTEQFTTRITRWNGIGWNYRVDDEDRARQHSRYIMIYGDCWR